MQLGLGEITHAVRFDASLVKKSVLAKDVLPKHSAFLRVKAPAPSCIPLLEILWRYELVSTKISPLELCAKTLSPYSFQPFLFAGYEQAGMLIIGAPHAYLT